MADRVMYVMHGRGATWGKVSGRHYSWRDGREIEAPEGEFDHMRDGTYQTRPMRPTTEAPGPETDYEALVEQYESSPGWYKVPGVDKSLRRDEAIEALKNG